MLLQFAVTSITEEVNITAIQQSYMKPGTKIRFEKI